MSEALKPCPFCGSADVVALDTDDGIYSVICNGCGVAANRGDTLPEADPIAAWNRREGAMNSRFSIGGRAYFQPNLRLVNAATGKTDAEVAAPCEIVAITFTAGKVYYDLDVIYIETLDDGTPIESRIRMSRVQSDMVAEGA